MREGEPASTSEANRRLFARDLSKFESLELEPVEQALLSEFRERWLDVRMLDLGIGTGRTTYTFAPLAGEYHGIDYVPEMIEVARQVVPESERVRLYVGDARRLTEQFDSGFDLILFSYNGIDAVTHDERMDVLRQVRELLNPEGVYCFSAHSVDGLPLDSPPLVLDVRNPVRSAYRSARALQAKKRARRVNSGLDLEAMRARGWGLVADGSHGFDERWYYITAQEQLRQLVDAGFDSVEVLANDGRTVDPSRPGGDPWLHYWCQSG